MLAVLAACHGTTVAEQHDLCYFIRRCAVITRTKILSFASSKVSAVVLTWPVMDNDDCTPYCKLLQLDSLQKR